MRTEIGDDRVTRVRLLVCLQIMQIQQCQKSYRFHYLEKCIE